jgi:hypothetical protein
MFSILPRIDDFPALAELRGNGQTLHFHATDPGLGVAGEWLVRRTPSGVEWEHRQGRCRPGRSGTGPAAGVEPARSPGRLRRPCPWRPRPARPLAGARPAGACLRRPATGRCRGAGAGGGRRGRSRPGTGPGPSGP